VQASVPLPEAVNPRQSARERQCWEKSQEILDYIEASRNVWCSSDKECATVTSPRSIDHKIAVHRVIEAKVRQRVEAHYKGCKAGGHHDPRFGYTTTQAACQKNRCAAVEIRFHIEED
jgi:hypothetical protein